MKKIFGIKIIASLLLLLSLFLPLSQCSGLVKEGSNEEPLAVKQYFYEPENSESIVAVVSWAFPILFVVLGIWYSSKILLSVLQLTSVIWAGFVLWGHLVFSHKVLVGGYIAGTAILLYLLATIIGLFLQIREIRLTKSSNEDAESGAV